MEFARNTWELDPIPLLGYFQLKIFYYFQDILCHTCIRLPAHGDQIIITTPKAFVGFLAGWGGKLPAALTATSGTPSIQLQNIQPCPAARGLHRSLRFPWRIPAGPTPVPVLGITAWLERGWTQNPPAHPAHGGFEFWSPHP